MPYARSFSQPRPQVETALKELQGYSGQKLPTLDGFVAVSDKPLDHYERGFYQFSIDLLPGDSGGTLVRLSVKITAWYADKDVTKSGYQVLPSNGRLELDFLDRLEEKLTGKPVSTSSSATASSSSVQAPAPKLDLSSARAAATMASPLPSSANQPPDQVATLRNQRVAAEHRVQQLNEELKNLQDIQHSQGHPQDLVIVKRSGTPVYAHAADNSRLFFEASANDEFEFIDMDHNWVHITISGDSRGYLHAESVELPARVASQLDAPAATLQAKFPGFRIARDETSQFPGDWAPLKGKLVKLYTVQVVGQSAKDTGATARLNYCAALFQNAAKEAVAANPPLDGVVVIFDATDGGIVGATVPDIQKLAGGSLRRDAFWQQSYLDPPDAFQPTQPGAK
jgi:hypothetical protein